MPSVAVQQDVFQAGGNVATDWGSAGGNAQTTVVAGASIRRGINLELGVQALANVDASFGKFLSAELAGQAQAVASVSAQIQAPMNLFDEIGFAVRLQAIAELAAAVQLSLGLKMGDFIALASQDPNMRGLPVELLRVFLSEVDVKAGFFAKAALTAQAYAQLVVTGTAIANPAHNIKPGFNIVAGVGAGLKAGAGFRVFARMEFHDFSRFVARSVDLLVDAAAEEAADYLPEDQPALHIALDAARPVCKIALRTAYELGEFIALHAPPASASGSQDVALRCTQVILEESQRLILKGMTDAALEGLEGLIHGWLGSVAQSKWTNSLPSRTALADHLRQFPEEPFDGTQVVETYWNTLVSRVIDLAVALIGPTVDNATQRLVSVLWCSAQLALIAARRLVRADASLNIVGLPPRQVKASFSGGLTSQPPTLVRDHIRASLPAPPSGSLRLENLVEFLCADAALDFLRQNNPGVDKFLKSLSGPLGGVTNDVARQILRNIGSILRDSNGQLDAQSTLAAFTGGLRIFAQQELHNRLAPPLRERLLARPDLKTYFDEVFIPSIDFTLDVVFDMIEHWPQVGGNQDRLKEALSGILMKVVGRSLVVTTDIMTATAQDQIQDLLNGLADQVDAPNGIVAVLSNKANLPVPVSEISELTADALRIGAEVLGPLSDTQRATIRSLMYQVIDPLPLNADRSFIQLLASDAFIPNGDKMEALARELAAVGAERFLMFVQKLLELIARKVLDELADVLEAAHQMVVQWLADVQATLENIGRQIVEVLANIQRLGEEVAAAFDQVVDNLLGALSSLATQNGRRKLKTKIANEIIGDVFAVLNDNFVYANLVPPDAKNAVRSIARDEVEAALNIGVLDDMLQMIGEVADNIDDLVDDIRDLDPSHDLAEQIGNLVLNRLTDAIYNAFAGDPHINIGFDVRIGPISQHIGLGRIDVPLEALVDGLRNAVRSLSVVEDAIRDAANSLATAFAKELALQDAEQQRTELQDTQGKISQQMQALEVAPRSVRILSPALGSVVSNESRLRIEIQGITREAVAAEEGRPQAIHVYINQRELVLSRFSIIEIGALVGTGAKPASSLERFSMLSGTTLKPHPQAVSQLRAQMQPVRPPARPKSTIASAGRPDRSGRFALTATGAKMFSAPQIGIAGRSISTAVGNGRGKPFTNKIDRRLGAAVLTSQIGQIIEPSATGIILQCTLTDADVEAGINVASVSVTPPRGSRIETSVTFVADAAAKPAKPKPGEVRLPVAGGKPGKGFAPPKVTGKYLLAPKQQRMELARSQKRVLDERATVQRTALLAAIPSIVRPKTKPKLPLLQNFTSRS
jgi:BMFP domain-containing protein YqiC